MDLWGCGSRPQQERARADRLAVLLSQRRARAARRDSREAAKFRAANLQRFQRMNPRPQRSEAARLRVFSPLEQFAPDQVARDEVADALARDALDSRRLALSWY
jgi:hypothetical protein